MKKQIIISHPTANANTRAAAEGFSKAGMLECFYTCVACFKGDWLYNISAGPLKQFKRRMFSEVIRSKTHTHPFKEMMRMVAIKLHLNGLTSHESGKFCVDAVYRDLDRYVAKYLRKNNGNIDAVYAYEDCAFESFKMAKSLKKVCIYDLPIGYWRSMRNLLGQEAERNKDWAVTLGGFTDSEEKLKRKDEELALADKIYVASTFTKKTLEYYPGKLADVEVIPYGFPKVNSSRKYENFEGRKIKVLYVGGLSQRKGISYVFEAIKGLEKNIEMTMIGLGNIESCPALKQSLNNVNYIPSLPHNEILKIMSSQDILLFPSLFEGFGLVVTEAMSQGTPVITTDRTCGPDVITNGKDGWIVEAGTSVPIRKLLVDFIANPEILHEVGREALRTAQSRPWSNYEEELSLSVNDFLNDKIS